MKKLESFGYQMIKFITKTEFIYDYNKYPIKFKIVKGNKAEIFGIICTW